MPGDAIQARWTMDVRGGLRAAVALLLLTTGLSIYVDFQDREVRGREVNIRSALETTLRTQQETSSMLLIAVLEQNPLRLKGFEAVNAELELAIQSIANLNRHSEFSDEISALMERHGELIGAQRHAMSLMQAGRWREARQALVDESYVRSAGMHEIDLRTTVGAINIVLAAKAELFDMLRAVGIVLRIGSLILLLWVGAKYSRQLRDEVDMARRTQAELSASRQALRDLAAHEQAKREDERKHMAQEIHDELGQRLTVLRMDVALLPRAVAAAPSVELPRQAKKLKRDIDAIVAIVRDIAGQLRPVALEVGLAAAVEAMLQDFEQALGIPCELDNRLPAHRVLDEPRSSVAFRILQESMTNAARHAGATRIKVSLAESAGQLLLRVQDDGRGFSAATGSGFGLTGMRERAASLGGWAHIASQPGVGTTVEAAIPLDAALPPEPADGTATRRRSDASPG